MVGYTFYFMPGKSPQIGGLEGSGNGLKGVADHLGGLRAWILERSDFFKGPKGPLGPERSDFFKGPKGPLGPLGPERSDFFFSGDPRLKNKAKSQSD